MRPGDGAVRYLCPDFSTPSWGVGMIYLHVAVLARHGFDAAVVHTDPAFRPPWLEVDAPVAPVGLHRLEPAPQDVLVVPEVMAAEAGPAQSAGRKVLFSQNPYSLLSLLRADPQVGAGYSASMAVLPSVAEVVERFLGLRTHVVPPAIAPAFFAAPEDGPRERRILVFPPKVRLADAEILDALLNRELPENWEVTRLTGLRHSQVAELMRRSMFLVNLNVGESFNATVPEAMAAGCVPLCYEAWGGRDFLRHGENAFVFPNFYIYPLVETLLKLIEDPTTVGKVRARARATAERYREQATADALLAFIGRL